MKRPFGLIGLVYLSVLAVVFYCYSDALVIAICGCSLAAAVVSVVIHLWKRNSKIHVKAIAAGMSALLAVLSFVLYQNYIVQPIINNYSNREIYAEGYICDELQFKNRMTTFTIQTEKIDGKACSAKITYTTLDYHELAPFDEIKVNMTPRSSDYNSQLSKGIFLYAIEDDNTHLTTTGEKHFSLYSIAVRVRTSLKRSLDRALNSDAASLSKAILLGDKQALDSDVRDAFTRTGTSYLIVVSGMHLSIVTLLIRRLFRKREVNVWVTFVFIFVFVAAFAAITGFTPSVMRAGVMMLLIYAADIALRQADGINSLGIAALVLLLPNPYLVGDVGLLFSFSATFGILLWAEPIDEFCLKKLRLMQKPALDEEILLRDRIENLVKRGLRWPVALISASAAATLWVLPISILFFGTVSPLTVLVSLVAYPLTCVILLLAFPLSILYLIPFVRILVAPMAVIVNWLAEWLIYLIQFLARLKFAQISASETYWLVWLAVTASLVILGYLIHAKKSYVVAATVFSVLTLTIGGSLTYLFAENTATLSVYRFGSGYTVAVQSDDRLSLLSCGGDKRKKRKLLSEWENLNTIENIIIPSENKRNCNYLEDICNQFDFSHLYVYDSGNAEEKFPYLNTEFFSDDADFTLFLTDDAADKIVSAAGKTFQYVYSKDTAVLLIPDSASCADIPESMRHPDVVLLEGEVSGIELVDYKTVISVSEKSADFCADCAVIADGEQYQMNMK